MTRRRLALFGTATLVAGLGVLAPQPHIVVAEEAVVASETVELTEVDDAGAVEPAAAGEQSAPAEPTDRARVRQEVAPFDALGLTLQRPPSGDIHARGLVDGAWTPWFEVPFMVDEAPDAQVEATRPGIHSQPVWFGGAVAYELDAPPDADAVDVHLVRSQVTSRAIVATEPVAGAAQPGIAPRSAWGARPPARRPGTTVDLKMAVVHHSVNGNGYSAGSVPAMIRSIQAYHMDVNGWDDIAYNFVVDRYGRIWEGRAGGIDQIVLGGHSAGFNTSSTGVVVLGDFTASTPPAAALEAVAQVIAWKLVQHQVDPRSRVPYTTTGSSKHAAGSTLLLQRVVGHRDLQTTSCPGSQLYRRMGQIRSRVIELASAYASQAPSGLVSLHHPSTGLTDALQFRPGSGGDLWWRATGTGTVRRAATSVNGTYHAVSGDFDGNGLADVLWHGRGTAPDSIWWSTPRGSVSQPLTVSGSYLPVVGDFDGNGVDDVLWYGPGPNLDSVWSFQRDRTYRSAHVTQALLTARPLAGDFDGDGKDDVLWYGPGAGADDEIWHSTGSGFRTRPIRVSGYYQPVLASVDGDPAEDVVWISESGAGSSVWEFAPGGSYRSRPLPDAAPGARPEVGDLDGDGFDDVLVHAAGPAKDAVWFGAQGSTSVMEVSVRGSYLVSVGRTSGAGAVEDLLFVSPDGADYLWSGHADRTFTSSRVG